MTEENKPAARNPNDPRAYYMLERLLDAPDSFAIVPSRLLANLRASLDAVLAMPEGDVRVTLLRTLNSATNDAKRLRETQAEAQTLKEQLKAEKPTLAEANEAVKKVKIYVKLLHDKFNIVYNGEAKRGTDMWKTAWPWYEHELHVYTPAIVRSVEELARILKAAEEAPPAT